MNKEHNLISILNNELLLEAYAGAAMAIGDGSLDNIINSDLIWSDIQDIKKEILNRMDSGKERG